MKSQKHFYWLDWMRFIAALMVVICHARGYNWVEWGGLNGVDKNALTKLFFACTRAGLEWVVVFFVLSGFLVGGGVISRCLQGTFDFRIFIIDRISRIWVPLIPALLLSLAIALFCGLPHSLCDMVGNMFAFQGVFFKNFGHNEPLWSLSYEVWFYVIFCSLGVILSAKSSSRLVAFITLFLGFAVFTKLSPNFLLCWLLGSCSYFLISEKKRPSLLIAALLLAAIGTAISQLQSDSISISGSVWLGFLPSRNIATLIESAGIGLLIASICRFQPSSQLMVHLDKLGTALAAFSYTLYLTHYPILGLWEHFVPERSLSFSVGSLIIFVAKISSCLIAGWLIYLPFEANTPMVRIWLRKRFNV